VPVAPGVGQSLAEPGASNLATELGLEAAAGVASAAGHRALDVAQRRLHIRPGRADEGGDELHACPTKPDSDTSRGDWLNPAPPGEQPLEHGSAEVFRQTQGQSRECTDWIGRGAERHDRHIANVQILSAGNT
jgi:hypothetical protein